MFYLMSTFREAMPLPTNKKNQKSNGHHSRQMLHKHENHQLVLITLLTSCPFLLPLLSVELGFSFSSTLYDLKN